MFFFFQNGIASYNGLIGLVQDLLLALLGKFF